MGTFFGIIACVLIIVYPPYMLIKLAIYGRGLFFPNFRRITEKLNRNLYGFQVDYTGWFGKLNYYFVFFFTLCEIALLVYLFIR